jgi:PAS domain S-box-containing protein
MDMSRESDRRRDQPGEPTVPLATHAFLEALPGLVWTTTADGRTATFANGRFREYAGCEIAQAVTADLIAPDDLARTLAAWKHALATKTPMELESRIRRNDGAYRWHVVRAVPVRDERGRLVAWCGTAIDTEAHHRAEHAFRILAATLPEFIWTAEPDGYVDYWNEQLIAFTGIRPARSIGHAWTSIVHPDDLESVGRRWNEMISSGRSFESRHRLRRHDGVYRWFLARTEPAFDQRGDIERFVGSATNIDDQERAQLALAFLDGVSDLLGSVSDVVGTLKIVAERAVPAIADWCSIYLFQDDGRPEPIAIAHRDPDRVAAAWQLVRQYPPEASDAVMARVRARESTLMQTIARDDLAAVAVDARHLDLLLEFDIHSAIVAPITARGKTYGSINLISGHGRMLGPDEQRLAESVGKRIGVALENAHIFERERLISTTFQQAALSQALPSVPGLDLHAVYVPAEREAEIGGDWYDAFTLEDGRVVVSIGDVAGKGLEAAVLMGNLRQAIRLIALKGFDPGEILESTSLLVAHESSERFATAFVGIIDPQTWSMNYASAAHPPPIFRRPDGTTIFLSFEAAPPLGLISSTPRIATLVSIPANSLLVLYTDGLIEATRDIFVGEERLRATVASQALMHSGDPARLIRDTVLHDGVHDDVAVLTVAFGRSKRWSFDARDAMSAHGARSSFVAALRAEGTDDGDYLGSEVIFGELIGNVVRHAPGPIDVTLDWSGHEPVLHVIDRGPGFVRLPVLPDTMSESGRGLYIIDTLAREFIAAPIPGRGTHVTVRLPVERADYESVSNA